MKKIIIFITILILAHCSFDNKTGIWQNNNEISKKSEKFKNFKNLSTQEKQFEEIIKIPQNLKINLRPIKKNLVWLNKNYNNSNNLDNFSYNILIANLHEMQNFFSKELNTSYTQKTLKENFSKILITMLPIVPHLANECLKILNINNLEWPDYDEKLLIEEQINYVIQRNGKKRALILSERNISENDLVDIINKEENLKKYLSCKKIKKKIFVPNRLMNIII